MSQDDQDILNVVLAYIRDHIDANPAQTHIRIATKQPFFRLPNGGGKLTVPMPVWEVMKDAVALKAWDISIEPGEGTSPEFTMNKR